MMRRLAQHLRLINTWCEYWLNHLYLINTWCQDRYCTYVWSTHDAKTSTALTSDQHMMWILAQHLRLVNTWWEDWLDTYIHPDKNTSYHSDGRGCTHIWSCSKLQSHQNGPSPPRLSYLVTDQAPPFSSRMAISLTSDLLVGMANPHIWHGRN